MSDDNPTGEYQSGDLVVLFADIADSTKIYEEFGDTIARDATSACITIITDVGARLQGRLVKTIGDEAMIVFQDAVKAVMASNEMQMAVQRAGEEGSFATGPLRVKIGLHYGPGLEEETDVFGEAALVATALVNMAKPDQILTSNGTLDQVPPALRVGSRPVDRTLVDGVSSEIEVYEMIWEVSEMTQMADIRPVRARVTHTRLVLVYQGQEYEVSDDHPVLTIGRVEGNDVVVPTDLTSRKHSEIEFSRGRFHLSDNSSNGTVLVTDNGSQQALRRDKATLGETGKICFGGKPEENPTGIATFTCK